MAALSGSPRLGRLDGVRAPAQGRPGAVTSSRHRREEPLTRGGSWREARMAALGSFSAMQSQLSRRAADDNAAHAGLSSGTREAHGSRGWPGAALVDDIDELFSGDAVLEARAEVESCGSLDSFGSGSPDFGGHACCCAAAGDSPSTDRRAAAREELPSACCEPGGSGLSARESVTKGQASGLSPSRKHRLEGPEPRGPRRSGEPPAAPLSSPVVTSASALAALAGGERPAGHFPHPTATPAAGERGRSAAAQALAGQGPGACCVRETRAAAGGECAGTAATAGRAEAAGCPGVPCCSEATRQPGRQRDQPHARGCCSPELEAGSELMVISTSKHANEDLAESSEDWDAEEQRRPPAARQPVSKLVRRSGSRMPLPTSISFRAAGCPSTERRGPLGTRPPPLQLVGDPVPQPSATAPGGFCSPSRAAPPGRSGMGRAAASHGNMHAGPAAGSGASPASSAASTVVAPQASRYPCTDGSVASRTVCGASDHIGCAPLLAQPAGGSDRSRSPRSAREHAVWLASLAATPQPSDYPDERAALCGGSSHVAGVPSASALAAASDLPVPDVLQAQARSTGPSAASAPTDAWDLQRTPRDQ